MQRDFFYFEKKCISYFSISELVIKNKLKKRHKLIKMSKKDFVFMKKIL